jgi:hypothetical protein
MAKYIYQPANGKYPHECGMGGGEIKIASGSNKNGIPAGHYIILNGEEFVTYYPDGADGADVMSAGIVKTSFEGDAEVRVSPNWIGHKTVQWAPFIP